MKNVKDINMKVTDVISITELAKLLNKSRPTIYKYIFDYENGDKKALPEPIYQLFSQISAGTLPKSEVYDYCEKWFSYVDSTKKTRADKSNEVSVKDVIRLIKANQDKINFYKLKAIIEEDINNER